MPVRWILHFFLSLFSTFLLCSSLYLLFIYLLLFSSLDSGSFEPKRMERGSGLTEGKGRGWVSEMAGLGLLDLDRKGFGV